MVTVKTRYLIYIILFAFLITNSCVTMPDIPDVPENPVTEEDFVRIAVITKARAIVERDKDKFLNTLDRANTEYYDEQRLWFDDYLGTKIDGFTLKIKSIRKIDESTCIANLHQEYYYIEKIKNGVRKSRRITDYNEKYIKNDKGWVDSGLYFFEKRTDNFIIKLPGEIDDPEIMNKLAEEAEEAYKRVVKSYGKEIDELNVLKFYNNRELLRQETRISRSGKLDGWYGHSGGLIKIYLLKDKSDTHIPTLAHELIHKITISITTNLTDWFAEGLAVYYGSYAGSDDTYLSEGKCKLKELIKPISWLDNRYTYKITDGTETKIYYAMSGMVVKYMVEEYGDGKVKEIVEGLSKYPGVNSQCTRKEYEKIMSRYMYKEIKNVLDVDSETSSSKWLEWIKKQGGKKKDKS